MRRRGKRRGTRQGAQPQQAAHDWSPASPGDAPDEEPQAEGVPIRTLIAIPRNAGLTGWVAAAALTGHEAWKELVASTAEVRQLAVGPHWRNDLPQPSAAERAAFAAATAEDFERRQGYLFLGVGDGSGSFADSGVEACLEQVLAFMGMPTAGIGKLLEGDPSCTVPRYPRVPATPTMAVRALWRLVAAGVLPEREAAEASRTLGQMLFEAIARGAFVNAEDVTLPRLQAMRRSRREDWPLGKAMLRAILATDGWLRLAEADWKRRGRIIPVGMADAQGVFRTLRLALCRTHSPSFTVWARKEIEADVLVRVEDRGFFAQVVGSKPAVQASLRSAAGIWRRALLTRRATVEEEAAASSPGHVPWSPIHLDPQGACAGNRHEADPHLGDLPYRAAELEERLVKALQVQFPG